MSTRYVDLETCSVVDFFNLLDDGNDQLIITDNNDILVNHPSLLQIVKNEHNTDGNKSVAIKSGWDYITIRKLKEN